MLADAKKVLDIESKAIKDLSAKLGAPFTKAVNLIYKCKGRLIITGMGKPGFIAGKMAATFASTGTPSLSIHAADAVHGDLGMVTRQDIVMAISNSGETEEVIKLLSTIKKIGCPLIALTGNPKSTLAKHSNVVLDVSVKKEACPMNLAPTTSTTVTLALGDAMAVVLMKKKKFKVKDFAFYHPGGSLGRKLLKVKDIMRTGRNHPVIKVNSSIKSALVKITAARAGCCTVVDQKGKLKGIFTDGDLRRHLEDNTQKNLIGQKIEKFMTKKPLTISPDQLAAEAFRILRDKKIDELVVVNAQQKPVGLLDVQDFLDAGFV